MVNRFVAASAWLAMAVAVPALRENRMQAGAVERLCTKSKPGLCPHMKAWFRVPGGEEDVDAALFTFNVDYEKTTVNGAPAVTTPYMTLWAVKGALTYNDALWVVKDEKPAWRFYVSLASPRQARRTHSGAVDCLLA